MVADSGRDQALVESDEAEMQPPVVRVNRRQIERALGNLLENAERHGGGITGIRITDDDHAVYIMIDDTGPGVAVADRERIFARFARAQASRGSGRGTGLGLSLVAETALRHDGSVWCTQNPEGGARFVLRLPRSQGIAENPGQQTIAGA